MNLEINQGKNIPCSMMWDYVAPVDDGIAQRLVRIVHAHFGTYAPAKALLGARLHFGEAFQIIVDRVVTML